MKRRQKWGRNARESSRTLEKWMGSSYVHSSRFILNHLTHLFSYTLTHHFSCVLCFCRLKHLLSYPAAHQWWKFLIFSNFSKIQNENSFPNPFRISQFGQKNQKQRLKFMRNNPNPMNIIDVWRCILCVAQWFSCYCFFFLLPFTHGCWGNNEKKSKRADKFVTKFQFMPQGWYFNI